MYYSNEIIDEINDRNDIVDVIGSYVSLTHKGNSYTCCCPFHHEKTPSFSVSRERQMYHCFGCGVSGSVYTFLMNYENISFPEAVKVLAERCGYELPVQEYSKEEKARENYRTMLKDMNRTAAAYFHYLLTQTDHGQTARKYLKNRGFTEETIKNFGMGYSDKYENDLYNYLKHKGYTDEQMKNSGLVEINERKGGRDIFWNRVMVPILDINGKVIAFGGRVLGDAKPKYINTKETPIFNKRQNLFAMNIAKKSKRKGIIVCEGYMDVIAMHQAGFDNAVASLGTAFTINQANIIKRYTDEVYLAYDSDGAGTAASLKNIAILRQVGIAAKVIDMKPYKDPDEFIKNLGSEAYEERVKNAVLGVDFEAKVISEKYNLNVPEEKAKFANEIAERLAHIDDVIVRTGYIEKLSQGYNIDINGLKSKVTQYGTIVAKENDREVKYDEGGYSNEPRTQTQEYRNNKKADEKHEQEKLLLTWLVNDTSLFGRIHNVVTADDFDDEDYHLVAETLFKQFQDTGQVKPSAIVNIFDDIDKQNLVGRILQADIPEDLSIEEKENAINEIVKSIKMNCIEAKLAKCKDIKEMQELIKERAGLDKLHISL